jgi:hypothetical protein
MILENSRINLHKVTKLISKYIRAIKVDALFIAPKDQNKVDKILKYHGYYKHEKKGFYAIGTLKKPELCTKQFLTNMKKEIEYQAQPTFYIPNIPIILDDEEKTMNKKDRNRFKETDVILDNDDYTGVHIDAIVPGAGKTYLIEQYCKRKYQPGKTLFVTPWNALASDIRKRNFTAITLYNLCGKMIQYEQVDEFIKKKKHDVSQYDHIHFDEICLYSPNELNWIYEFVKYDKPKHIKITSTGDPGQLKPVNAGDFYKERKAWYKMMLDTLFSETIQLQICKRLKNKKDRKRMYQMCQDLLHETKPIKTILREAKLKEIDFKDLTTDDFQYPHICALQNTSSKIDNLASKLLNKPNNGTYEIGEELIGVKSFGCK